MLALAKDVTETSVTLTLANTEYPYTIPAGTRQILFHLRSLGYNLQYSFTTGGPYRTVPAGGSRELTQIFIGAAKIIYLKCADSAGEIVDIETWQ